MKRFTNLLVTFIRYHKEAIMARFKAIIYVKSLKGFYPLVTVDTSSGIVTFEARNGIKTTSINDVGSFRFNTDILVAK